MPINEGVPKQGVERAWGRWEEEEGAFAARSMNWARGAKGEEANQEVDDDENALSSMLQCASVT